MVVLHMRGNIIAASIFLRSASDNVLIGLIKRSDKMALLTDTGE
jgi:hypothetical protein